MDELRDDPGVYVVLDEPIGAFVIPAYTCLDVGESSAVHTRVSSHEREPCWRRNALGRIVFAVLYMPGAGPDSRRDCEAVVRSLSAFPCSSQRWRPTQGPGSLGTALS